MKFFQKKPSEKPANIAIQTAREIDSGTNVFEFSSERVSSEGRLYDGLRNAVPIIDAAIGKIIRLTGGFRLVCADKNVQTELDNFAKNVKVGLSGRTLNSFIDSYLDSLLTYGNAVGEILIDNETKQVAGLYNGDVKDIEVRAGASPIDAEYFVKGANGKPIKLNNPNLILFSALNPPPNQPYGKSVLSGLPYISAILMRIYECIGQNFDRVGNVRYAVTYKPQDSGDMGFAKDRAEQIAKEWSDGMQASKSGQIRDFVAVGDVGIKVIGAENQIIDTNIPVKQLLEQIIAKLSIPPFLLGLSWSTTERMSGQQADILTSELQYYRRLLNPVILQIAEAYLRLLGSTSEVEVIWDAINLQDEVEDAEARLKNAQAEEIEQRLNKNNIN
ncbi:MAG: serine/threonine protein phosphatase [Oscillospiraceae bacterium]